MENQILQKKHTFGAETEINQDKYVSTITANNAFKSLAVTVLAYGRDKRVPVYHVDEGFLSKAVPS